MSEREIEQEHKHEYEQTILATNLEMKTKELSHEHEARKGTALKR